MVAETIRGISALPRTINTNQRARQASGSNYFRCQRLYLEGKGEKQKKPENRSINCQSAAKLSWSGPSEVKSVRYRERIFDCSHGLMVVRVEEPSQQPRASQSSGALLLSCVLFGSNTREIITLPKSKSIHQMHWHNSCVDFSCS